MDCHLCSFIRCALIWAILLPAVGTAERHAPEKVTEKISQETIKIGWIGPLTGNSAVLGIDSVPSAQLAISQMNSAGGIAGKMVELLVEDDEHETTKSVSAYRKLVGQGAVAIFMSTYGGFVAAANSGGQTVLINPLDCNEQIAKLPRNVFCIATLTESISRVIADHILQSKLLPATIIYDHHHPFMAIVADALRSRLEPATVAVSEIDQASLTDYRTLLLRARSQKARSLVLLGHDPIAQAMKEARQLGLSSQFYTVGTITSPGFQEIAGAAANGTLVAYWEAPRTEAFASYLAAFTKKVGRKPILELASVPSFDATIILLNALRRSSNDGDIIRALLDTKRHQGLAGEITIDPDGVVRSIQERLYVFQDGTLAPIE